MFTKNIKFKNFVNKKNIKISKILRSIIKDKDLIKKYPLLKSMKRQKIQIPNSYNIYKKLIS